MKFSIRTLFNYKEIKTGIVFGLAGLAIMALGVYFFITTNKPDYLKTEAVITQINTEWGATSTDYTVWVQYSVDGVEYSRTLDTYDASMYEGKTIDIYYNPQNPNQIYVQSTFAYIFLLIFGGLFALVGFSSLIKVARQLKAEQNLRTREEESGHVTTVRPTTASLLEQGYDWRKYHFEPDMTDLSCFLFKMTDEYNATVGDVRIPRIQTIFGNKAEFTNHIRKQTTIHKFGMETETNDNSAIGFVGAAMRVNKTWNFDGVDSVVYLRNMGIRVFIEKADQIGLGALVKYAITRDGRPLAVMEPTVFTGPASQLAIIGSMPNGYCFDVQCAEKDMDTVLIVAFALLKGCNIFE